MSQQSIPVCGIGPSFGESSQSAFASGTSTVLGSTSTTFGAMSTPAFGASSTLSFSFASHPEAETKATTPKFGCFRMPSLGSRICSYTTATDLDCGGLLMSISAMSVYKDKSHEELRWEDYHLGDKARPFFPGRIGSGVTPAKSNPFGQSSASPTSMATFSNSFIPKTNFGTSIAPTFSTSLFGVSSASNHFQSASAFGSTSSSAFTGSLSPSPFGTSSSSIFGSTPSLFSSTTTQGTASPFGSKRNCVKTQTSPLFQSTTTSFGHTGFGQASTFEQSTTSYCQSCLSRMASTGFGGNMLLSTPSLIPLTIPVGFCQNTPFLSAPFQLSQPSQATCAFGLGNFSQTQAAKTSDIAGAPNFFCQTNFGSSPLGLHIFLPVGVQVPCQLTLIPVQGTVFGPSCTPSFGFSSSPGFGQSNSAFGSSPFGTTTSPFGTQ